MASAKFKKELIEAISIYTSLKDESKEIEDKFYWDKEIKRLQYVYMMADSIIK